MGTAFVVLTTASCKGFAYRVQASPVQIAILNKAVEEYNTVDNWTARNCDGSAEVLEGEAEIAEWYKREWGDEEDGVLVKTWDELAGWMEDDGDAYDADIADLIRYLKDTKRQMENDQPSRARA